MQLLPETLRTLLEATPAGLVWTRTRFCRVEDGVRDVFSLVQIRATEAFFFFRESGWKAGVHGNQYSSKLGRHALKLSSRRWDRPLHRESPGFCLSGEESQRSGEFTPDTPARPRGPFFRPALGPSLLLSPPSAGLSPSKLKKELTGSENRMRGCPLAEERPRLASFSLPPGKSSGLSTPEHRVLVPLLPHPLLVRGTPPPTPPPQGC